MTKRRPVVANANRSAIVPRPRATMTRKTLPQSQYVVIVIIVVNVVMTTIIRWWLTTRVCVWMCSRSNKWRPSGTKRVWSAPCASCCRAVVCAAPDARVRSASGVVCSGTCGLCVCDEARHNDIDDAAIAVCVGMLLNCNRRRASCWCWCTLLRQSLTRPTLCRVHWRHPHGTKYIIIAVFILSFFHFF